MKIKVIWFFSIALAGFMSTLAGAQTLPLKYKIHFNGTCWTTNDNGHIMPQHVNNHTLLQEVAQADGTTNYASWGLAYHVGGDELGDTIEIINRHTGETLRVLFGLYFGEDFGRVNIISGSGRQMRRIEYVYTDQNSHSLGSAFLTDYFWLDNSGATNRMMVLGDMQYVVAADARHPKTQVCKAHFATAQPWTFSAAP